VGRGLGGGGQAVLEVDWGELKPTKTQRLNGNGKNGGSYDPAFTGNKYEPIHRWVPWVAGYSFNFVDDVLIRYSKPAETTTVLDPFAGVGTTLLQAHRRGCDVIGFEINPWAALVSRTKLAAGEQLSSQPLEEAVEKYRAFVKHHRRPESRPPEGFRSRIAFFSPKVERKVLVALDFIKSLEDEWMRDAFRVAFGAVMVSFSNYTYEPSLGSRPGAGKSLIEDADVSSKLSAKVLQMVEDVKMIESRRPSKTAWVVHHQDFMDFEEHESRLADVVITSPPYLNNYHYVRNTRPQLWWLSLVQDTSDLQTLEEHNIGKFWQTVRDLEEVSLQFENERLSATLGSLREIRKEKGAYGGGGWANYAASYFNDTWRFMTVLAKALRPGGIAVIVIGNSIVQGVNLKVDEILADIAAPCGFETVRVDILRHNRVGGSILNSSVRRGSLPGEAVRLYESAVILRRSVR